MDMHLLSSYQLDRWQHTDIWSSASSYGLSKHATVQALEAAVILANPSALRLLPDDKSHWPAAVSSATSGLLGSEDLNIDVLREGFTASSGDDVNNRAAGIGMFSESMPVKHSSLSTSATDAESSFVEDEMEEDEETSSEDDLGVLPPLPAYTPDMAGGPGGDSDMDTMDQNMFSMDLNRAQSASLSAAGPGPASGLSHQPYPHPVSNLTYTRSHNAAIASLSSSATITAPHSHSRSRPIGTTYRNLREQSASSTGTTASASASASCGDGVEEKEATESVSGSETKDSGYTSGSVLATSGGADIEGGWMERKLPAAAASEFLSSERPAPSAHLHSPEQETLKTRHLNQRPGELRHLNGHVSHSAPVLGFFTEETRQTRPARVTGMETGQSEYGMLAIRDLEATAAEVLSSSSHSHRSYSRSPYLHPQPLPAFLSPAHPSSLTDSHPRMIKPNLGVPSNPVTSASHSFGQAPLGPSSLRPSSFSRSTGQTHADPPTQSLHAPSPDQALGYGDSEKGKDRGAEEREEVEDELMEMDL